MPAHRRRLPHIYAVGQPNFLTFRLHDSLPPNREFRNHSMTSGGAFAAMDRLLDESRRGPLYLSTPEIAREVKCAIRDADGRNYNLHAFVIMPNHVHMLITPLIDLPRLMQLLKGSTACYGNQFWRREGPFWQNERYDHLVRSGEEFRKIEMYILENPVKAGLVTAAELHPWSSASRAG